MIQIPRWRYWLSHVWEQTLETTSSEHNDYLQVSLVRGRLQLTAEDAIYSFADYYLNFRKTFKKFDFSRLPKQADVLILGLGLGSIANLLSEVYQRDYHYTAVEIDPVIVDLAAEYSLPRLSVPVEVVTADAFYFLQLNARKYDLICMDVFQDAIIPDLMESKDYLRLLKATLKPGGALIYNRLAATSEDRKESKAFFEEEFLSIFTKGDYLDTGGNYMLLNDGNFLFSEDEKDLSWMSGRVHRSLR